MALEYPIDPASGVPAYRQLGETIRAYVAAGALKPGDQLPSIRAMSLLSRINPGTIAKAYARLARDGILTLRQGSGAFVADKISARALPQASKIARDEIARAVSSARRAGLSNAEIREIFAEELGKKSGD